MKANFNMKTEEIELCEAESCFGQQKEINVIIIQSRPFAGVRICDIPCVGL